MQCMQRGFGVALDVADQVEVSSRAVDGSHQDRWAILSSTKSVVLNPPAGSLTTPASVSILKDESRAQQPV